MSGSALAGGVRAGAALLGKQSSSPFLIDSRLTVAANETRKGSGVLDLLFPQAPIHNISNQEFFPEKMIQTEGHSTNDTDNKRLRIYTLFRALIALHLPYLRFRIPSGKSKSQYSKKKQLWSVGISPRGHREKAPRLGRAKKMDSHSSAIPIMPQAILDPAFPVGWDVRSSSWACTIIARPIMDRVPVKEMTGSVHS